MDYLKFILVHFPRKNFNLSSMVDALMKRIFQFIRSIGDPLSTPHKTGCYVKRRSHAIIIVDVMQLWKKNKFMSSPYGLRGICYMYIRVL